MNEMKQNNVIKFECNGMEYEIMYAQGRFFFEYDEGLYSLSEEEMAKAISDGLDYVNERDE